MYPQGFLDGWRCNVEPRTLYKIMYLYYKVGKGPMELAKRYGLQSGYVSQVVRGQSASTKRVLDAVNVDINSGVDRSNCYPYHNKEELDAAYDKAAEVKDKEEKMPTKKPKQHSRKARMTYDRAVEGFKRFFNGEDMKTLCQHFGVKRQFFTNTISNLRRGHRMSYAMVACARAFLEVGDNRKHKGLGRPPRLLTLSEIPESVLQKAKSKNPEKKATKKKANPKVNRVNAKSVPSPRFFEKNGVIMVEETVVRTRTATVEEITKLAARAL